MTCIISWVQESERLGLLLADDKISNFCDCKVDKIQLIYGRWAVSVYGSSLLKSLIDDLSYFNNKANKPNIDSMPGFLSILSDLAHAVLPYKIRWLENSTIERKALELVKNCSSGYIILDCKKFQLFQLHLKRAIDIQNKLDSSSLKVLAPNKVWYFGYYTSPGFVNAEHGDSRNLTPDYAKKRLVEIARLYPEHVGNVGSYVYVEKEQVLFYSLWDNTSDFAHSQVGYEPYYIKQVSP